MQPSHPCAAVLYGASIPRDMQARPWQHLAPVLAAAGLTLEDTPPPAFWTLVFGTPDDPARWADRSLDWPSPAQWDRYHEQRHAALAETWRPISARPISAYIRPGEYLDCPGDCPGCGGQGCPVWHYG